MTRTELIKKIINYAGVQEKDAKQFIELFLIKLASELENKQIFYHEKLGYFYFQKISVENYHDKISTDVIFYSTTNNFLEIHPFGNNLSQTLLFNIPSSKNQIIDEVSSYFSLSIGKPTIPKDKMNDYETFAYLSEYETHSLLESKIEKLFQQGKILNENETQFLNQKNIYTNENELENLISDFSSVEEELSSEIPWDFGKDWKQEFDEEIILNSDEEETTRYKFDKINEEEFSWDFGYVDETKQDKAQEENNLTFKQADSTIQNNKIEKDVIENNNQSMEHLDLSMIVEEIKSEIKSDNKIIETKSDQTDESKMDDFQLVKTRTRELKIDLSQFQEILDDENSNDFQSYEDYILEQEQKVETKNKFVKIDKLSSQEKIENKPKIVQKEITTSDYIKKGEEKGKQIKTSKPPEVVKENQKILRKQKELKNFDKNLKKEKVLKHNNTFFFVLSAIFAVVIFFIVYWKMYGIPTWLYTSPKVTQKNITKSNPVVIERDYEIPVNYPYKIDGNVIKQKEESKVEINSESQSSSKNKIEDNNVLDQTDESSIFSKKNINNQMFNKENAIKSNQEIKTNNQKLQDKQDYNDRIYTNTGELIYKSGSSFTIQLSSWQSKDKANQIINKFISNGYDAYIEEVNLNGERWFRVKVRNFKSVEEAKNFISKNK